MQTQTLVHTDSQLDTIRSVETPEGITLNLRVCGPAIRSIAWSIDLLIRSAINIIFLIALTSLGEMGFGIFLLCNFLLEWFYPVFFEIYKNGQTPGKKSMGIRVINDNGTPVDWSSSMLRNLLRVVDFLPIAYGLGFISTILNKDFKRLGDLVAGTVVIYIDDEKQIPKIKKISPEPTIISLTLEEQQAVINFAERHDTLTQDRAAELASIASSLTKDTESPSLTLIKHANWLIGRRKQ